MRRLVVAAVAALLAAGTGTTARAADCSPETLTGDNAFDCTPPPTVRGLVFGVRGCGYRYDATHEVLYPQRAHGYLSSDPIVVAYATSVTMWCASGPNRVSWTQNGPVGVLPPTEVPLSQDGYQLTCGAEWTYSDGTTGSYVAC